MKLSDARGHYERHSTKASDVVRQLGFAGIAVIWIFSEYSGRAGAVPDEVLVPEPLLLPGVLIVLGLGLDLLQYVLAAALWGGFNRYQELQDDIGPNDDFTAPRWINWPALGCFWGKILAVGAAYVLIGCYILGLVLG